MAFLTLTPENIADHPWIWDFLEEQRKASQYLWQANTEHQYQEFTFKFNQTVFARARKNAARGYAYEMISAEKLGAGMNGAVYPVSCTISYGKTGKFQITDKHRVVKINPDQASAKQEYHQTTHAEHLHAKPPTEGYMVIKKMEGICLDKFNKEQTHAETLALTKAIFKAYKAQVYNKGLLHNDLHHGNIMVKEHPERQEERFEINIIDYDMASLHKPETLHELNQTRFTDLLLPVIELWRKKPGTPAVITQLLSGNYSTKEDLFQLVDEIIIAPTAESQKLCDQISTYLKELAITNKEIAKQVKNRLLNALQQSNQNSMDALKKAVYECQVLLQEQNLDPNNAFSVVFDENPKKQQAFNKIFDYFHVVELKGKALMANAQQKEGAALCALASALRNQTFIAAHKPTHEQNKALEECRSLCQHQLKEHQELLDIHRNNNYIWAEIGVVLCSLIVLYPIVTAINYTLNGRWGFFSQTNTASGAEKMTADFSTLTP